MLKKITSLFIAIIFVLAAFPIGQLAEAATTYTFLEIVEVDTYDNKGKPLGTSITGVKVQNNVGKVTTLKIDKSTVYYINNTATNIHGFKAGMQVSVTMGLNKIREMRANTNSGSGSIVANSKQLTGVVTQIDPNGLQMRVKIDGSTTRTFTINKNTEVFKNNSSVDLSTLYAGDKVRLTFATATTSTIAEIDIINSSAIMVQELYKAKLNTINTNKNSINVRNAHPLLNWRFGTQDTIAQTNFAFTNTTSIYVGNKKITKNQLGNYRNNEMYFATTKQFSKEVINKIIVLANNERTYYEPISLVNLDFNVIELRNTLKLDYHSGSILIRNGRLVDPESLVATNLDQQAISTTAFVITDGHARNDYAHVVNITNDGLLAPNLSTDQLYFGVIDVADMLAYRIDLTSLERFDNHFWNTNYDVTEFAFSNSTKATELDGTTSFKVIPELDLDLYDNYTNYPKNPYYGYFYVRDGHIQGIHFVPGEARSSITFTGRIAEVKQSAKQIVVKDSSQWNQNGNWNYNYGAHTLNLSQAMIVKNGKVINFTDLKPSDRVVALAKSSSDVHVLLVNE